MRRRLDPLSATAHAYLGWATQRSGDVEQAVSGLRHALELEPNHFQARYFLGWFLGAAGHVQAALAEFRTLLNSDPDSVTARAGLGIHLAAGGQRQEARQVLEELDKLATKRYVTQFAYLMIHFQWHPTAGP
jgi:Flp pilus assembly protein TadD